MNRTLNILIADDSPTSRQMLAHIVDTAPNMRVVGQAINGKQAVKLANELHPDAILMDLVMPDMDGLAATREIMHSAPTPIVVVSATLESRETKVAFEAIGAGALTAIPKPVGVRDPRHSVQAAQLISTLRTMAEVQVIHHWRAPARPVNTPATPKNTPQPIYRPQIVAIASSTGGPAALGEIIGALPPSFNLPMVIVQHIAPDFVEALASWLTTLTPLRIKIAEAGESPEPSTIYLAPGGLHLRLLPTRRFGLSRAPEQAPHIPSCDVLLESVAQSYGAQSCGVILTGMGADGARGLKAMADKGAFTIAQNQATCVVYGMPQEAVRLGAARQELALNEIAPVLTFLAKVVDQTSWNNLPSSSS